MSEPAVSDSAGSGSGSAPALAGQVVVVTGGAGGIGQACALAAHQAGARVVVADLDVERATRVAAAIDPTGADAYAVGIDVTDRRQCQRLAMSTVKKFGRVDGAVLAAGMARHVPLRDLARAQWDAMLAVHLTGAFMCVQALTSRMPATGGSLVYIASTVTLGTGPLHQAHYVAAKSGALGFVRAAARELGPAGIRFNAVSPGFTDTALNDGLFDDHEVAARIAATPLGRVATPPDVAGAAIFLLGAVSSFITGQTLLVNGGAQLC